MDYKTDIQKPGGLMENRNFKVMEANLIYLILAIIFVTFGAMVQEWNLNMGLIITEYIIILLPVIIFGKALDVDFKRALRLNKIKGKTALLIIVIAFFLIPLVAFLNFIPISILTFFGKFINPAMPSPQTTSEFLMMFFVVAISAGLCEEVLFRGLVMNAYESAYNKKAGAIAAALMFGIFHFNIQNLFGPIAIGLMAAYLVHITDSLYSAIILHISNNGIAVISDYFSGAEPSAETVDIVAQGNGNVEMIGYTLLFLGIIAVVSILIGKILLKFIKNDCYYFKPGDSFVKNKIEYVVLENNKNNLVFGIEKEIFDGRIYDVFSEKSDTVKALKCKKIKRTSGIWNDKKIGTGTSILSYIPVAVVVSFYIYVFILHITYLG